jgi:putative component of toxin-antitoxin plasmid stabilization module
MIEIRKTDVFALWLDGLRDLQARARIQVRIERLAGGDKSTQAKDIKTALRLARDLSEQAP